MAKKGQKVSSDKKVSLRRLDSLGGILKLSESEAKRLLDYEKKIKSINYELIVDEVTNDSPDRSPLEESKE